MNDSNTKIKRKRIARGLNSSEISANETSVKIKRRRMELAINQATVSKLVGISQTAYGKIELGITSNITIEVGKSIAKALKTSFNQLFDVEEFNTDSLIMNLKSNNEELKIENKRLQRELENYRTLINLLKEKNIVYFPRDEKTADDSRK